MNVNDGQLGQLGDNNMRLATLIPPCLGLALIATAGCDPLQEKHYLREGIGTDLSRPEMANTTALLTQYIGYICKQAGLELIPDESAASCSDRSFTPAQWVQFVKAGMNDIDVRCDAYLAWLDNRRRSAEPLLRQIGDMGRATGSILDATGVGPHAMNIVGIAFGMAANTFTNVNSRLLLEVNQATVQSVVHKGQEEFRYRNDYTNTFNRSDAIYHLRSYLRLCMPFTIETDINTTVAIAKRVGPQSLENNPLIAPETDAPDLSRSSGPRPMATGSTQAPQPRTSNQKLVTKTRRRCPRAMRPSSKSSRTTAPSSSRPRRSRRSTRCSACLGQNGRASARPCASKSRSGRRPRLSPSPSTVSWTRRKGTC